MRDLGEILLLLWLLLLLPITTVTYLPSANVKHEIQHRSSTTHKTPPPRSKWCWRNCYKHIGAAYLKKKHISDTQNKYLTYWWPWGRPNWFCFSSRRSYILAKVQMPYSWLGTRIGRLEFTKDRLDSYSIRQGSKHFKAAFQYLPTIFR